MPEISNSSPSRDSARQAEEIKNEHEKRLAKLRADLQAKEENVKASGDATISHIRKNTEERIESTRAASGEKIQREEDAVRRNYAGLKQRVSKQSEILESQLSQDRAETDRALQQNRERELHAVNQSQEKLRQFTVEQQEARARIKQQAEEDIQSSGKIGNERITQQKSTAAEKLKALQKEERERLEQLKSGNRSLYDDTKAQADRRLKEIRTDSATKLENERRESTTALEVVRTKGGDAVKSEQREGEQRLGQQKTLNQRQLEADRARALTTNEKMQAEYSRESQRVEVEGQTDVNSRQAKFDLLRREQDAANRAQLKQLDVELKILEDRSREEHQGRIEKTITTLQSELEQQRKDFKQRYSREGETYHDSLTHQKQVYLKELYKQKRALESRSNLESARSEDPFYRLKGFDARLEETAGGYLLKAKVAPHERENVEVKVKDDKVILSAKRAYEDKYEGDGSRATTNSYQTFRQEFQLGAPADAKSVLKTVKEDGSISVIIPKKNFDIKA